MRACRLGWPIYASRPTSFGAAKGVPRGMLVSVVTLIADTCGCVSHTFRPCNLLGKQRYRRDLQ